MKKERYQEAEIKIMRFEKEDIVFTSNEPDDDKPIELPFVPAK